MNMLIVHNDDLRHIQPTGPKLLNLHLSISFTHTQTQNGAIRSSQIRPTLYSPTIPFVPQQHPLLERQIEREMGEEDSNKD